MALRGAIYAYKVSIRGSYVLQYICHHISTKMFGGRLSVNCIAFRDEVEVTRGTSATLNAGYVAEYLL
jgi:hypothetical protein